MRAAGSVALIFAVALAVHTAAAVQTATPAAKAAPAAKPVYICIMPGDEDVEEDHPGKCRKCGMDLHLIESVFTCPVHAAIHQSKAGLCPIDKRELIPVTMLVTWTCPGSTTESTTAGKCADGTPKKKNYAPRAHGNHNPQHGGQFFMAQDQWHHLEGAYLPTGVFRMYFYDDFTKPLPLAALRDIKVQLVAKDSRTGKESTYSLVRSGRYLQAEIGSLPLPAAMYARVKFKPADAKDNRFDFTFDAYSKEPVSAPAPTMTSAAPVPAAPATPASLMPDGSGGIDPALVPLPIPDTVPEILSQLKARTEQVGALIDKGIFAAIYVPAFQAKDLALALDEHKNALSPEHRRMAEPAISRLVRSAYLLDAFGDIGNKQQIAEAYAKFVEASKDIQSAFPQ